MVPGPISLQNFIYCGITELRAAQRFLVAKFHLQLAARVSVDSRRLPYVPRCFKVGVKSTDKSLHHDQIIPATESFKSCGLFENVKNMITTIRNMTILNFL